MKNVGIYLNGWGSLDDDSSDGDSSDADSSDDLIERYLAPNEVQLTQLLARLADLPDLSVSFLHKLFEDMLPLGGHRLLQAIGGLRGLSSLDLLLEVRAAGPNMLAPLCRLPLQHLSLHQEFDVAGVSEFFADVSAITTLTSLRISTSPPVLNSLVNLKHLALVEPRCSLTSLTRLEYFEFVPGDGDFDASILPNTTTLQHLCVIDNVDHIQAIAPLLEYPLTRLDFLEGVSLPEDTVLPATLQYLKMARDELPSISHLTGLTSLYTCSTDVLQSPNFLSNLRGLTIVTPLDRNEAAHLSRFVHLTSLDICPEHKLRIKLTNLQRLGLECRPSSLPDLSSLSNITDLRLRFSGLAKCSKIDISPLASLTKMRSLSIQPMPALKRVPKPEFFSSLQSLTLYTPWTTSHSNQWLQFVSALTQLTSLTMRDFDSDSIFHNLPGNVCIVRLEDCARDLPKWQQQVQLGRCVLQQ